jgi:hypothetical protein
LAADFEEYKYKMPRVRTAVKLTEILIGSEACTPEYRVSINYRRILQNNIFTNTEQKYMMLLPFERGKFAVS